MPLAALSKRPKLDQNDFGSSPLLNNDKENKVNLFFMACLCFLLIF